MLTVIGGWWDIFRSNMLTVGGQQHWFWTHKRMCSWMCQSFWDRKCLDLRGTRTPNLRIHAECSNHFELSGPDICCPMFVNTGSGGIDIFWSKVNIWNVICARVTAFIFDTRTDVLVKVSNFFRQNVSTWGGFKPPTFGLMPNALTILSYQDHP